MTALILDERCFVSVSYFFFLLMKMEEAISGTSAATYKVMEPHLSKTFFFNFDSPFRFHFFHK